MFIHAMRKRSYPLAALVPVVHLAAACLTLANFRPDGCLATVPILLGAGVLMGCLAAFLAWRLALQPPRLLHSRSAPPHWH